MLGYDVDAINSVQFSNHTGYSIWKGQVLNAGDLDNLFDGILSNGFYPKYSHILTGYIASVSFMEKVYEVVTKLKELVPGIKYTCDPVMGDDGQMYVAKELLPFYRDQLIQLADVLVPNQFEAELLTGIAINCEKDAWKAIDALHNKGVPLIVISSSSLSSTSDTIVAIASHQKSSPNGAQLERVKVEIPKIPASFVGTGDLTAALLTAWLDITNNDLREALTKTMSTVKKVLDKTYNSAKSSSEGLSPSTLELKLVSCKKYIECPETVVKALDV